MIRGHDDRCATCAHWPHTTPAEDGKRRCHVLSERLCADMLCTEGSWCDAHAVAYSRPYNIYQPLKFASCEAGNGAYSHRDVESGTWAYWQVKP